MTSSDMNRRPRQNPEADLVGWLTGLKQYTRHTNLGCGERYCFCGLSEARLKVAHSELDLINGGTDPVVIDQVNLQYIGTKHVMGEVDEYKDEEEK